jgi:hypothetical protein
MYSYKDSKLIYKPGLFQRLHEAEDWQTAPASAQRISPEVFGPSPCVKRYLTAQERTISPLLYRLVHGDTTQRTNWL